MLDKEVNGYRSTEVRKLHSFHIRSLRRILRIPWFRKITNAEVLREAGMEDIGTEWEKRRWRYLGLRWPGSIIA